jgi:light-regulated signal transduction histidine kinase (bacteriophytochrome)
MQQDQNDHLPEKLIQQAAQNGKATHEGWRLRKDGTTFWGYTVITALHDEHNNITGYSKVTRDLTERKISEEKLKEYAAHVAKKNEELEIINKDLESFTYMASHDLQEPLRKIRTFIGFIMNKADEQLTPQTKDYFNRIVTAADRMQTLIEDLLTYSRTNISDHKYEPVSLSEIIEEVKKNLSEIIEEKNAKIEFHDLPVLNILPQQFLQLFTNLIDNAIKYNRENISPVIKISSRKINAKDILPSAHTKYAYKISVEDNGIGFEMEYAEKIFGLFQRLHGQSDYPGTGIGLAICKKIVQNHKGEINATGEPGKGSVFNIYLPAE